MTVRRSQTPSRRAQAAVEADLEVLLPALAKVLADKGRGSHRLDWIRGE